MPTVRDADVGANYAVVRDPTNTFYGVYPTIDVSNVLCVIAHGAVASTARTPTDAGAVYWLGTVAPANAVVGDLYGNTSTGVILMVTAASVTAGHASGTGTANTASTTIKPNAAVASATGTAYNATAQTSSTGPTLTYLQEVHDETDLTTYTFAAQNIGAAAAGRHIIVAIHGRSSGTPTVSTVTVGGVSATVVAQTNVATAGNDCGGLAIAAVPTGTTGDVVVTFNTGMLRAGIQLYRTVGLTSATAHATTTDVSSSNSDLVQASTINVPAAGILIAAGNLGGPDITAATATWVGVTEDNNTNISSFFKGVCGSEEFASSETGRTIQMTWSVVGGMSGLIVAASWA